MAEEKMRVVTQIVKKPEVIEIMNDMAASLELLVEQLPHAKCAELCRILAGTPPGKHKMLKYLLNRDAGKERRVAFMEAPKS